MRRASICLAVLGLIALGLPALSSAAEPTASITKFTAKAIPIPKPGGGNWPKTGNVLGAGSAVEAEYEFTGEGYGATPQNPKGGIPPISQVNFYLPAGAKIHPQGFAKCAEATLKNVGPSGCPKTSIASPLIGSFFHARKMDRHDYVVVLAAIFELNAVIQLIGYSLLGLYTPNIIAIGLLGARGHRARSAAGVGENDPHQGGRGVQKGQENHLLRHAAEEVQGRAPRQDRSHLRRLEPVRQLRYPRQNGARHLQSAVPQEALLGERGEATPGEA